MHFEVPLLDIIKGVFDLTRAPAMAILGLAVVSGILWFGWDSWAAKPTLGSLRKGEGFWIALVFVLSAGFSLVSIDYHQGTP